MWCDVAFVAAGPLHHHHLDEARVASLLDGASSAPQSTTYPPPSRVHAPPSQLPLASPLSPTFDPHSLHVPAFQPPALSNSALTPALPANGGCVSANQRRAPPEKLKMTLDLSHMKNEDRRQSCTSRVTSLTHKNDDSDVDVLKALVTSQLGVAACSGVVSDASDTEMED